MTCQRGYLPFSSAGKTPAEQRQSQFWLGRYVECAHSRNSATMTWPIDSIWAVTSRCLCSVLWAAFRGALWFTGAGCTSLWSYSVSGFSNARCKHFKPSEVAAPHMFQIQVSPWEISQKLTKSKARGMYSFELALMRQMKPSLICGFPPCLTSEGSEECCQSSQLWLQTVTGHLKNRDLILFDSEMQTTDTSLTVF